MKIKQLLFLALIFFCCNDECDNVSCLNGTCQDGTCFCENGWVGENCSCQFINCRNNGIFNPENCNCDCPEDCLGDSCEICPELIVSSSSNRTSLCPDFIGGSDENFKGNGPLAELEVSFYITENREEVRTIIVFKLTETEGSNPTVASGKWDFLLWKAPEEHEILSIETNSEPVKLLDIDQSTSLNTFFFPFSAEGEHIFRKWEYMGDTSGDDVGGCGSGYSFVNVFFHPATFKIRKRA